MRRSSFVADERRADHMRPSYSGGSPLDEGEEALARREAQEEMGGADFGGVGRGRGHRFVREGTFAPPGADGPGGGAFGFAGYAALAKQSSRERWGSYRGRGGGGSPPWDGGRDAPPDGRRGSGSGSFYRGGGSGGGAAPLSYAALADPDAMDEVVSSVRQGGRHARDSEDRGAGRAQRSVRRSRSRDAHRPASGGGAHIPTADSDKSAPSAPHTPQGAEAVDMDVDFDDDVQPPPPPPPAPSGPPSESGPSRTGTPGGTPPQQPPPLLLPKAEPFRRYSSSAHVPTPPGTQHGYAAESGGEDEKASPQQGFKPGARGKLQMQQQAAAAEAAEEEETAAAAVAAAALGPPMDPMTEMKVVLVRLRDEFARSQCAWDENTRWLSILQRRMDALMMQHTRAPLQSMSSSSVVQ
ncbi:hypothetical protein JKP88DRAFT_28637 [Tribonema minus]|uniref:Uncharacterized protein n=1 Tax=Tribonema minus TaxID=303371 RepID=A0A836CIU6_9STRA|nr:hypothetical protein JKP88DRAFT_28637 [Tribonema minus]